MGEYYLLYCVHGIIIYMEVFVMENKTKKFISAVISVVFLFSYILGSISSVGAVENLTNTTSTNNMGISFAIVNDETHWYYADGSDWHYSGIKIYENGEMVNNVDKTELSFSFNGHEGVTPENVYLS